MKNMKRLLCMALAATALMTAMPMQSLAASDYKYITNISLKVSIDLDSGDEISSGDSLGTSSSDSGSKVYTSSSKYEVESAEWSNDREVGIGDTPKITVYLDPNTSSSSAYEYRFRSSYSASSVSISGGIFVSASRSGDQLKVVLKATGIKGTYDPPEDAEWGSSRGRARWEEADNTSGYYDVYLYRGSSVVKKLEDYKGTSYNFYPYMTKEGDYSFKVRTVPHTDEEKKYGKKRITMGAAPPAAAIQTLAGARKAIPGTLGIRTATCRRTAGLSGMINGISLTAQAGCSQAGSRPADSGMTWAKAET